jgi:cell division protein FtsW
LIVMVWGALLFLSGRPLRNAVLFAALALIGVVMAYFAFDHVQARVDRFLFTGPQANSQLERAVESFAQGGFLGRGPGEGTIKSALPDAHTDFIFAVIAEEYGVVACLALVALYGFIVLRAFVRGWRDPDMATRLAVAGLALALGFQALINMSVNVGLMPAKGMTLPFISAGGSSLLSVSFLFGMLLALTRRRPDVHRLKKPRFAVTVEGFQSTGHRTS